MTRLGDCFTYFSFSSQRLCNQVIRLIAIRFLLYMGAMGSFYIGVLGTLTYVMNGGAGANAIAVALINALIMVGGIQSGQLLDRLGPRIHVRVCITLMVACGLAYQVLGTSTVGIFLGAAFFGLAWGMSDIIQTSYPAYLTDDADELKRINAAIAMAGNIALVIGPTIGGAIVLVAPTQAVFLFMSACSLLTVIPGFGFQPLHSATEDAARAQGNMGCEDTAGAVREAISEDGAKLANEPLSPVAPASSSAPADPTVAPQGNAIKVGFAEIFSSGVLSLLFWATMLSFMGYGAFDPLESLFYRDVLRVGASWMGWLSALSGVGGIAGAVLVSMLPTRHMNVRTLLIVLAATGVGSFVYVATPYVAVACVGQLLLGVAFSAFGPIKTTLVQMHTPLSSIGRVNAAMGAGYNFAGVFPLLCAPVLAGVFGVQGTLVGAAAFVMAIPMLILVVCRRSLADMVRTERARECAGSVAGDEASGL